MDAQRSARDEVRPFGRELGVHQREWTGSMSHREEWGGRGEGGREGEVGWTGQRLHFGHPPAFVGPSLKTLAGIDL